MTNTPDTYRTVTPYLLVADADAALMFVARAFDAVERLCQRNADQSVMHAEVMIGDSLVMLGQAGRRWPARSGSLFLWVDDVDASYARALAAGAVSECEPEDKPYGHRNAGVVDGNGITWWLAAPVRSQAEAAPGSVVGAS